MRRIRGAPEETDQAPPADGSALLKVEKVCASYGSYRALFGISFEVKPGAIVALLGSNGAGKSTVARVVSGLVAVSSGRVVFNNQDISAMPAFRIARLGMVHVPEGRGIFSSLTVEENLLLSFRQRLARASVPAALEQAYTAFPILADRKGQIAGTLSGGQQRILALSRVLATTPRLLIVDELSLGLAPAIVDNVYETLVKIRQTGCAVLVVEQQVDRALEIADEALLLARGLVAWSGPASEASSAMDQVLGGRMIDMSEDAAAGAGAAVPEELPKPAMEEVAEKLSGHSVIDPESNGSAGSLHSSSTVPMNGDFHSSRSAPS
jgi:branched-chain amino acid transport system ATP-binding protein